MPLRAPPYLLLILAATGPQVAGAPDTPAQTAFHSIPLPGLSGRIDHLALDADGNRLFLAALGNNTVEAIDLGTGKLIQTLGKLDEPQGIAYLPRSRRLYVADGGDGQVAVFGGMPWERVRTLDLGSDADNLRFDPGRDRVYVGYGDGGIAAIEDATGKVAWRAALAGHPESFQSEASGARIFVNVPAAGEIAVVEKEQGRVVAHWKTGALRSNFPMALDESGHRLMVGFRSPPALGLFDTETGKLLAREAIHRDADDVYWDSVSARIYAACGEGFLDRFERTGPGTLRRLEPVPTRSGARTGLLAPDRKAFYLAVPGRLGATAEIRVIPLD